MRLKSNLNNLITNICLTDIVRSLWQSENLDDFDNYLEARKAQAEYPSRGGEITLQQTGDKLRPYLQELKNSIIKTDQDIVKEEFKTKGFLSVLHNNGEIQEQLKAVDYVINTL